MELPEKLDAWTFQTVLEVVRTSEFEPAQFDYKEVLNATGTGRAAFNASLRRTVCAMANSGGGFMLFGVRDRGQQVATPEDRVVGILLGGDLRKEFGEKITTLQPDVYFETLPKPLLLPNDKQRGLFVVRIPASPRRPHMVRPEGVFYRRGEGGSAIPMDLYEVREQFLFNYERLRKATLLRLEIAGYRRQIAKMRELGEAITGCLHRFDTSAFKVLLADTCGLLPPEDALLQGLLEIPVIANLVNEFLNQTTYPGLRVRQAGKPDPDIARREAIVQNVAILDSLCISCERRLQEILGPLTNPDR